MRLDASKVRIVVSSDNYGKIEFHRWNNQFQQVTWKIKNEIVIEIMCLKIWLKYFTNLYKHKEVLIPFEMLC